MLKIIMIAAGGAVGAVLRYVVTGACQKLTDGDFPIGTLVVNSSGCLLIGFLGTTLAGSTVRQEYGFALIIGLLGAFTTFSTFGAETIFLVQSKQIPLAAANVALSNSIGLLAVWVGYRVAEHWFGAGSSA